MGRRGPKPEPAAVKEMKGNPGNRRIGKAPVEDLEAKSFVPPAWLKDEGLAIWKKLAPMLVQMRILTRIDAWTFARYCRNFARWLEMNKRLDDVGEIYEIETDSGTVRRSDPSFIMADRLERQLIAAEANFGLNPAERQRLFAARAALGAQGTLFDTPAGKGEAPTAPAPAVSGSSPVGLLN
ncbi:MAG: phage terminase small subunit P27 family [Devosia sp.]